ncbi:MAG: heme biosynthesis protein HemY [Geminicoccaceae bacterium]
MIRLVIFFIVVAVLAWAAAWLANNPGDIQISWLGYEAQPSMGVLVAAIAILMLAAVLIVELLRWLYVLPKRVVRAREHSKEKEGYQAMAMGMVAAAAGDPAETRAFKKRAEKLLGEDHAGNLLLAAQNAELEGKRELAHLKYQRMLKTPETEFLGLRGLLSDALKRGDLEEALTHARKAYRRKPDTQWVLTTLFDLLTRTNRWKEGLRVIDDMRRHKLLTSAEATRRRAILHHMQAKELGEEGKIGDALPLARQAASLSPGFAPPAVQASELALADGSDRLARKVIETCWSRKPHPDLAKAYAALVTEESADARIERFERLYNLQPNDTVTLQTMAEIALAAGRKEKARDYIDRAIKDQPTAGTYRLAAEIERSIDRNSTKAAEHETMALQAQADHTWVCQETGRVSDHWGPFGPEGDFDSLAWETPPKVATLVTDHDHADGFVLDAPKAGDGAAAPSDVSGAKIVPVKPEPTVVDVKSAAS